MSEPMTWTERFTEALTLITGQTPPSELVDAWFTSDSHELQDWVGTTSAPWWLQNIGALDAALVMANTPIEGVPEEINYEFDYLKREE